MIQIDIDGKKYLGPEPGKWDQLTIDKAIELSKVIRGIPPKLRKMYDDWINGKRFDYSDWTDEDTLRNHPRFFTRVIETLYSLPEGALQLTLGNVNEIQSFYNSYCQKFVLGIIHLPVDFEPLNMLEFRYRGKRYFMPAPFETYKEEIPLGLAAGDQITEALDILNISRELQEGKMEVLPLLVASICLPAGEKYDSQVVLERSKSFGGLPMSIALEVFFYCINFSTDAALYGLRSATMGAGVTGTPTIRAALKDLGTAALYSLSSDGTKVRTKKSKRLNLWSILH